MTTRDSTRHPALQALALGAAHTALFALAFPPFDVWPFAFVAVAPLMQLARETARPRMAALVVWGCALVGWGFHQRWVAAVSAAGYPTLVAYLALYPALFVLLGAWIARAAGWRARPARLGAALGAIWFGLEALRGMVVFHGYPWYLLADPTIDFPGWRQWAAVGGVFGVSAMATAVNAALAVAWWRRSWRIGAATAGLVAGAAGLGFALAPRADEGDVFRVAVIQTNVPQDNRRSWTIEQQIEDFARFTALTAEAAETAPRPDVIVWPETMHPGLALNASAVAAERARFERALFTDELVALQSGLGVPMIVGAAAREGLRFVDEDEGRVRIEQDRAFNSAFVIEGGVIREGRYDKIHLTPFGEVMPYISWSDTLEQRLLDLGARGMRFDLEAGERAARLEVGGARVATPICFEATMPQVVRRLVFEDGGRRADVIVQLTNDGWFGAARGGRAQHLRSVRWRAIETRTPVIRAANTGISAVIDSRGVVQRRGPDGAKGNWGVEGILRGEVRVAQGNSLTMAARLREAAAWLGIVALIGAVVWRTLLAWGASDDDEGAKGRGRSGPPEGATS